MSNVNTSNAAQGIVNLAKVVMGNAAFDTTIRAIVQEKVDNATGKFKLQYQDSAFYAFADDIKTNYTKGTEVFVLVPQNDFTQDKRIIGSVKTLGEDYVGVFTDDERYKKIGASAFGETNGGEEGFGIKSAWKENAESPLENSESMLVLSPDGNFLNYLQQDGVDGIWLEATFTTKNLEWVENANYGLTVKFNLQDNKTLDLTIDTDNMVGNPFSLYGDRQVVVFGLSEKATIDFADIISINSVSLWSDGFTTPVDNNNIFVEDIKMYAVSAIEEEQLNAPRAEIWTPQGTYVAEDGSVELVGRLRIEGKIQDNVKYFWFEENLSINKDSGKEYHPYGGRGWKLLNRAIPNDDGTFKIEDINKDTLWVYDSGWTSTEMDILKIQLDIPKKLYKCVIAKSDSERYEATVEVTNNAIETNPYVIKCNSEVSSSITLEDGGSISFVVYKGNTQQKSVFWYKKDLFDTEWSPIEGDVPNNPERLTILYSNISTQMQIRAMVNGVMTQTVTLIAEAEIPDPTPQYQLVIMNADQTFIYDEDGRSPTHPAKVFKENEPRPLSFKLYDTYAPSDVYDITDQIGRFKWEINTSGLIKGESLEQIQPNQGWEGSWNQFNFRLKDAWSYDTVDNQITLTVEYQSDSSNDAPKATITAKTNFTFIKQGDPGTNGTDVAIVITKGENSSWVIKKYIGSEVVQINDVTPQKVTYKQGNETIETEVYKATVTEDDKVYYGYYVPHVIVNNNTLYRLVGSPSQYVVYDADGTNPKYADFQFEKKDGNGNWGLMTNITFNDKSSLRAAIPQTFNSDLAKSEGVFQVKVKEGTTEITTITLLASLNRHAFSMVNKWDGNLNIDTDNNCVLAQSVIAGTKDGVNSFTGIIIGEIGKTVKSKQESKSGLFGYNKGGQTAFISAEDGSVAFGPSSNPLVRIGGNDEEFIQSSNYGESNSISKFVYTYSNTGNVFIIQNISGVRSTRNEDGTYDVIPKGNTSTYQNCVPVYTSGMKIDLKTGNIYAPGYSIIDGDATFSGTVYAQSGSFNGTVYAQSGTFYDDVIIGSTTQKKVSDVLDELAQAVADLDTRIRYINLSSSGTLSVGTTIPTDGSNGGSITNLSSSNVVFPNGSFGEYTGTAGKDDATYGIGMVATPNGGVVAASTQGAKIQYGNNSFYVNSDSCRAVVQGMQLTLTEITI